LAGKRSGFVIFGDGLENRVIAMKINYFAASLKWTPGIPWKASLKRR
jgi:hypothetical protein